MALLVRDNRVYTLALRDTNPGALNGFSLANSGTYFTETVDVGTFSEGILFLNMISVTGTNPTLDVKLQYSPDGKNWVDSGDSFTQVTTTVSLTLKKLTANFGKYVRCLIAVGGTATPTYKLSLFLALKA